MRYIDGLREARESSNPHGKSRPRGSKAAGLAFERKVGKKLLLATHNPWFEFSDRNGRGFCSPDYVIVREKWLVVLECKLTSVAEAREQLLFLYKPVLEHVYKLPMRGIIVVKNAPGLGLRIAEDFLEAETLA